MHKQVYATETGRYGTRMLTAGERLTVSGPQARAMQALGRVTSRKPTRDRAPAAKPVADDVAAVREEYEAKLGKRPFNGWDIATLREKIAAA